MDKGGVSHDIKSEVNLIHRLALNADVPTHIFSNKMMEQQLRGKDLTKIIVISLELLFKVIQVTQRNRSIEERKARFSM